MLGSQQIRSLVSPRLSRSVFLGVLLVSASIVLHAAPAQGYPQWQLSTGAVRCSQCHYAPGGGGLISSYGRDAAADDLSTFSGDGGLLHGAVTLPRWLALGGDLRGAVAGNDVGDPSGSKAAAFPMQADLYARLALPGGISFYGVGGVRGQVRRSGDIVPMQNYQPITKSQLVSREHWAMWQPSVVGPYLRAGRFFAPFGLRMAEHILYVRRDLGFNLLQETYNLSGGFILDKAELHVTAFAPDFLRHIGSNEKGVAFYYERRLLGDLLAVSGQGRIAVAPGVTKFMFGAVGKGYVEPIRTLFLAEVNAVEQTFDDDSVSTRDQLVGAAGFAVLPTRGLMVTLLGERNQIDIQVRDAAVTAATALLNWFPYPHLELQVMGRLQFPAGGYTAKTVFAQLHYYL